MDKKIHNCSGFTLVELMITVAFSGLIVIIISVAYTSQQRSYLAQEQVAEMQQNIRAAIDMMAKEIKMAGYDFTDDAGAGITAAFAGQLSFTQDLNSDGDTSDPGEIIDFGFSEVIDNDNDRDGVPDIVVNGVPDALNLGRQTGGAGGYQPIAEHIQAIEFHYRDADGTALPFPITLANIRSVQITILARAGNPDQNFTNTFAYCPASNPFNPATGLCTNPAPSKIWGPYNDHYRRRLLITTVQLRNMGI